MRLETKIALNAATTMIALCALSLLIHLLRAEPVDAAGRSLRHLVVPVVGVRVAELSDTWGAARSGGRRHEGIDIMAPRGTPVRAATDGVIAKLFRSRLGGITIYQFDRSGRFILYYAHLQRYARGLSEGDRVRKGEVIGYVGSSGNASTPHLHFEIKRVGRGREWWRGVSFNPYLALISGQME